MYDHIRTSGSAGFPTGVITGSPPTTHHSVWPYQSFWQCRVSHWCNYRLTTYNISQCMTISEPPAVPGFPLVWLPAHHLQHITVYDHIRASVSAGFHSGVITGSPPTTHHSVWPYQSFWQCRVSHWCNYRLTTYDTSQCMTISEPLAVPGFPLM